MSILVNYYLKGSVFFLEFLIIEIKEILFFLKFLREYLFLLFLVEKLLYLLLFYGFFL